MKPTVFVTRMIPDDGIKILKESFNVKIYRGKTPIPRERILKEVETSHALLSLLTDRIDEQCLKRGKKLVIVANYAVGYDNIDVKAATKLGIAVTNTPGVLTEATAQLTWALILATARHLPQAHIFTKRGRFKGWDPTLFLGMELHQKTLGILGAGRIGSAVARKAPSFGMFVIYTDTKPNPGIEKDIGARKVSLNFLLKESDILTIHLPLTPQTQGLLGEKELRMMKKRSILINTARGPIVKEEALIKALKEGWIFAAGLDVYEKEPRVRKELFELGNVITLPHIGSATFETRTKMAIIAATNIKEALSGVIPTDLVNREVIGKWRGRTLSP